MSSSLIQFREDDSARILASKICEAMGIDLQTYLRICISKLNQEAKLPFSMEVDKKTLSAIKAGIAMDKAAAISKAYGNDKMTLDEINAEIDAARKEADSRNNAEKEATGIEADARKITA
ncbi:MAG: type II toxin-antitoxin system RelB/DinJ family antitoxin [Clostridia bacterium]|nr:type II toxin-antitoxin system RelB/DinJ family antitoxin [Clostridia bacterium]